MNNKRYKYIYVAKFANYLIMQGAVCRGTGIHPRTHKVFWCFDYDEIQPIYEKISKGEAGGASQGHTP